LKQGRVRTYVCKKSFVKPVACAFAEKGNLPGWKFVPSKSWWVRDCERRRKKIGSRLFFRVCEDLLRHFEGKKKCCEKSETVIRSFHISVLLQKSLPVSIFTVYNIHSCIVLTRGHYNYLHTYLLSVYYISYEVKSLTCPN
jgi:hypothetical protein